MSKARDKHPKVEAVIIRWVDSMKASGWHTYSPSGMECTTVGILKEKKPDRVVVAMNRSTEGDGDYMEIPTCAIKSVRRLKE